MQNKTIIKFIPTSRPHHFELTANGLRPGFIVKLELPPGTNRGDVLASLSKKIGDDVDATMEKFHNELAKIRERRGEQ